jgi:hypothetical protein
MSSGAAWPAQTFTGAFDAEAHSQRRDARFNAVGFKHWRYGARPGKDEA